MKGEREGLWFYWVVFSLSLLSELPYPSPAHRRVRKIHVQNCMYLNVQGTVATTTGHLLDLYEAIQMPAGPGILLYPHPQSPQAPALCTLQYTERTLQKCSVNQ